MIENLEKPDPVCAKRPNIPLLLSAESKEKHSCNSRNECCPLEGYSLKECMVI